MHCLITQTYSTEMAFQLFEWFFELFCYYYLHLFSTAYLRTFLSKLTHEATCQSLATACGHAQVKCVYALLRTSNWECL